MDIFRKRNIPVIFTDYPEHNVDISLFDRSKYNQIRQYGLSKSPLNIIHSSAIHYQGRFRKSKSMRLLNAFLDIFTSVGEYGDGKLYFNDIESNEFQAKSSEVIAVGLCIEIMSELFNINKNLIYLIEDVKKRCDFRFIKNSLEYIIESKGRKGSTTQAINDIFMKKQNYSSSFPKYGVISSLPRDGHCTSVNVIDPAFEPRRISREERIQKMLSYYSRLSYTTGFWRMGDLLSERALAIGKGAPLEQFDGKELEYDNIIKIGNAIEIRVGDFRSQVFFPKGDGFGFNLDLKGKLVCRYSNSFTMSNLF